MYRLAFYPNVEDDLNRLDKPTRSRVISKIHWLAEHAGEVAHKPLAGQWVGTYRLRVGDYRIIYTIDHKETLIVIHAIGHRREIYNI